jgi:hypothetical protein
MTREKTPPAAPPGWAEDFAKGPTEPAKVGDLPVPLPEADDRAMVPGDLRNALVEPASDDTKQAADTQSPDDWAKVLFPSTGKEPRVVQHTDLWKHGAAEALHRWKLYEHDNAAPMQLTKQQYEAALESASKPTEQGEYTPFPEALYDTSKEG